MKTEIIKLSPKNPDEKLLKEISKEISKGNLVAFPTETVYGLGADALNDKAVKKIFEAKGRPSDNPLIVHIAKKSDLKRLVAHIPESAKILIKKFWPGPLTIVLKKKDIVPHSVTCGLETVAVRMPENKIALGLIKFSNCPIAAPSANSSGKPSPTLASHVFEDLNGKIAKIIDGGKTKIGIESTVIDLSQDLPVLLRPGMIKLSALKRLLGEVHYEISPKNSSAPIRSPGMKYTHYSPKAKVVLFKEKNCTENIRKFLNSHENCAILKTSKTASYKHPEAFLGSTATQIAKNIFSTYRKMDKLGVKYILIEPIPSQEAFEGIKNRITKSAYKII
ncbi:MAG: L-threonylcarbamoyladenylate synthase [Candidatus Gracilibacteria bacterium]|jgi:L-threonylcarbamoyladenylate synthase|nr:L-threonylcarbamoyladenylate synthase [Candidatus Gracilibacteria bacterium]